MSKIAKNSVLDTITSFYLGSGDFNGIPVATLLEELEVEWEELRGVLGELVEEDRVGVLYIEADINPHIIRMGFEPTEKQIAKLNSGEPYHACIYPRPKHLQTALDRSRYNGEPYKLCLALGEPQLAYRSFDLTVLEFYRNDPRYLYKNNDISGYISVRDEFFESDKMMERDQIVLESFGFSYDSDLNRAVAVYLRYLAGLSPEHQQIWKAKELVGDYQLHPDYFRSTIAGNWGGQSTIFEAFLKEIYLINQMSEAMARPPLFLEPFGDYGENKLQKFSFLVRPTLEEYNSFVLLLDKILSDNINKDFFQNEVPYETEIERKDGKIQVQSKGTLQILDDWFRKYYQTEDWEPWDESIKTLRYIRKLRQKPAHALDENVFDQCYFKKQREIIIKAYNAVQTLRMMLANHPTVRAANIKIPGWVQEGRVWTY
jgi:hypothetical protein